MCSNCLCRTCMFNCNGEHWPHAYTQFSEDVDEADFCYPCEEECSHYDSDIRKRKKYLQSECTKYVKSVFYVHQENKQAEENAIKRRSQFKIIKR